MSPQSAARAYARVGLQTAVDAADPTRLVVMLYDGALASIREAGACLRRGDAAAKGQAIARALRILDEGLAAAVDEASGGDIARQLRDLYDYIGRRLTLANLRNDPALLEEASQLLAGLRDAWSSLC